MSQNAPQRTSLAEARAARMHRPEAAAAYEQTQLRFELAEAVRARREELGWSQRQLAERAGMTQPGIARFEAGGTTPTLPLLERLAAALGLTLTVSLAPAGRRSALARRASRQASADDRLRNIYAASTLNDDGRYGIGVVFRGTRQDLHFRRRALLSCQRLGRAPKRRRQPVATSEATVPNWLRWNVSGSPA
ncbi:MAG: helix-turn-helix domain-containing protein [Streptosporangiaceae bacterium]